MNLKDEANECSSNLGKVTAGDLRHRPAYSYRKASWVLALPHSGGCTVVHGLTFTPLLGIGSLVGIIFIFLGSSLVGNLIQN